MRRVRADMPLRCAAHIAEHIVHLLGKVLQAMCPLLEWNGRHAHGAFVARTRCRQGSEQTQLVAYA